MISSKLLAEVLLDAETIKAGALKTAQDSILEQFAPQVKETLNRLLEAELDIPSEDQELELGNEPGLEQDPLADQPDLTLNVRETNQVANRVKL